MLTDSQRVWADAHIGQTTTVPVLGEVRESFSSGGSAMQLVVHGDGRVVAPEGATMAQGVVSRWFDVGDGWVQFLAEGAHGPFVFRQQAALSEEDRLARGAIESRDETPTATAATEAARAAEEQAALETAFKEALGKVLAVK